MRQRLFLHYGWFLQNLEKGCIRTNMHTTVSAQSAQITYLFQIFAFYHKRLTRDIFLQIKSLKKSFRYISTSQMLIRKFRRS